MAANPTVTYNFVNGSNADSEQVDQNFADINAWLVANAMQIDGSKAFTAVPSGPATDPTTANQLARKAYVDAQVLAVPPRGILDHMQNTTLQGTSGVAATVTMLTIPYTLTTTRTYRISANWSAITNYSLGVSQMQIWRDAAIIQTVTAYGNGLLGGGSMYVLDGPSLSGDVHYYLKLYTACVSGAAIMGATTYPFTLTLEDVGQ